MIDDIIVRETNTRTEWMNKIAKNGTKKNTLNLLMAKTNVGKSLFDRDYFSREGEI